MTARPEKGVKVPEALYCCSDGGCADEQTFPASDLHWIPEWEGWYCEYCVDGRRRFERTEEIEVGVSLEEWLKELKNYGGGEMTKTYKGDEYPTEYECRSCWRRVELPDGVEMEEGLRYCGPCAITQIKQLRGEIKDERAKGANYREQIEALLQQRDDQQVRADRYALELSAAAVVLQDALPIGKVKHIGLMEVAAGVGELVKERDAAIKRRDELFAARDLAVSDGVFWKERCDELLKVCNESYFLFAHGVGAMVGEFDNRRRNEREAKRIMKRNLRVVEAVEKAREA